LAPPNFEIKLYDESRYSKHKKQKETALAAGSGTQHDHDDDDNSNNFLSHVPRQRNANIDNATQ